MTCNENMSSEQVVNVLEKAAHVLNRGWLQEMVEGSLAALDAEFFAGAGKAPSAQVAKVRALVAGATHTELLAVFYLLLNIDAGLKTRVLALDVGNRARIGRFLLDLRQELVLEFFCSGQSVAAFVQACGEGYCIA